MISTVINFSTLETKFFHSLIKEVSLFCDDIIIVAYDHFFNGDKENIELMDELKLKYSQLRWIIHPWDSSKNNKFWHNNARWLGLEKSKYDRILFLDADEIPDGYLMKRWLQYEPLHEHPLHMFSCYWYFREPQYQAKTTEGCGLLVDRTQVQKEMFFTDRERWFFQIYPIKIKGYCSLNKNIILNHFSWVRTKEEMLTKVKSWAHKSDRDWIGCVENEFKQDFSGKDFVHGYSYNTVLNIFDIKV